MKQIQGLDLPRYELADAQALQALAQGNAEANQQKRALKWIIEKACATYEWGYLDAPRRTEVQLGRQFAGQQIVGLINLNLSALRSKDNE